MSYPKIFYDNRFNDAAPVASTTAAGFDVANLLDFLPYTQWQPTALPATVTVDCGLAKAVDYWAVWGHDLNAQGATIELRKSSDNFGAVDVLVDSLTPGDDKPFMREVDTADERYWRFRITGATMPSLGIAAAGAALVLPQYLEPGFDPVGRKVMGTLNRTVKGNPRGREVKYELWEQTLDFTAIDRAWLRSTWKPAWEAHLRANPFVFAWDPAGHPDELHLVSVKDGYDGPHRGGTRANLRFELEGLLA